MKPINVELTYGFHNSLKNLLTKVIEDLP